VPGNWEPDGFALRNSKNMNIGLDFVTTHEGAQEGDFLYNNSYFANGANGQECQRARELHLDASLVPLATLPKPTPAQRSPLLSPSKRLSAITFEDGSQLAAGAVAAISPQRMYIDGAWRLSTSLGKSASSPSLPRHLGDAGKQPVPLRSERRVQLENRHLSDNRSASLAHVRQREMQDDMSRGAVWDERWGFPGRPIQDDSPSRRRPDPMNGKPTLVGFAV